MPNDQVAVGRVVILLARSLAQVGDRCEHCDDHLLSKQRRQVYDQKREDKFEFDAVTAPYRHACESGDETAEDRLDRVVQHEFKTAYGLMQRLRTSALR